MRALFNKFRQNKRDKKMLQSKNDCSDANREDESLRPKHDRRREKRVKTVGYERDTEITHVDEVMIIANNHPWGMK